VSSTLRQVPKKLFLTPPGVTSMICEHTLVVPGGAVTVVVNVLMPPGL
jgi:hypothetical protein